MNIRVAIVEDNLEICTLMQMIIDATPGYMCKQAYHSVEEALEDLKTSMPDIILMDIDLPGMSGINGLVKIREIDPKVLILMLTIHEDEDSVFDSLSKGANGYLLKGIAPVKLLEVIKEAYEGGAPMSPKIASKVVHSFHQHKPKKLSSRELEILELLCIGENYSSIAKQLFISRNTVKGHIKKIYSKLHVHTRAEVVIAAHKKRIIRI